MKNDKVKRTMMVSIQCTKKCFKFFLISACIGIYLIVLLRESFAAWESSSSTVPVTSAALKNSINENYLGDEVNFCNYIKKHIL